MIWKTILNSMQKERKTSLALNESGNVILTLNRMNEWKTQECKMK